MSNRYRPALQLLLLTTLAVAAGGAFGDDYDHGRRQAEARQAEERSSHVQMDHARMEHLQMDIRHGHNRAYPTVGTAFRSLPPGYFTTRYRGTPYYFRDGIWYRHASFGFAVVLPPAGAFITVLPPYYTTVMFGGIPYYYADNVYYRWDADQSGYIVGDPPAGAGETTANAGPAGEPFVYPKNGQSAGQLATDRYECHRWAADQSGFDPTRTGSNDNAGKRADYERAQAACLEARGYSVK